MNKSYSYKYPHPAVSTDCVIFGFDGKFLNVLLIKRGIEPYKGYWALPGGFVRIDESVEECAQRELREETGLTELFMEQLQVFSDVERDPRERVITVAFYALVKTSNVIGGDDASHAQWFRINEIPSLAFDHELIIKTAVHKLKEKIHFEPIGFELLPEVFTMSELQHLYEIILNMTFDRRNFYRKMINLGVLTPIRTNSDRTSNRIPIKYSFNKTRYDELKSSKFFLQF